MVDRHPFSTAGNSMGNCPNKLLRTSHSRPSLNSRYYRLALWSLVILANNQLVKSCLLDEDDENAPYRFQGPIRKDAQMKTNRQHSLVQSTPKRRNKKWKEKRAKSRRWLPLSSLGNSRGIHLSASYYPFFCSFLLSCYFGGGLFFFFCSLPCSLFRHLTAMEGKVARAAAPYIFGRRNATEIYQRETRREREKERGGELDLRGQKHARDPLE